jgi:hypothetical protein
MAGMAGALSTHCGTRRMSLNVSRKYFARIIFSSKSCDKQKILVKVDEHQLLAGLGRSPSHAVRAARATRNREDRRARCKLCALLLAQGRGDLAV